MRPPRPPCPALFRPVVCNPLISFVRLVVRLVEHAEQKVRPVVCKSLISFNRKIRLVFLRLPPYPPRVRARENSHRTRNEVEA